MKRIHRHPFTRLTGAVVLLLIGSCLLVHSFTPSVLPLKKLPLRQGNNNAAPDVRICRGLSLFVSTENSIADDSGAPATSQQSSASPPPPAVLNGKRVLPFKVLTAGLNGQGKLAAVYAVLNSSYQRGSDGWDAVEYVGVSQDVSAALESHLEKHGAGKVAHVRALSFQYPQPNAMQEVATQWRESARQAGAPIADPTSAEWGNVDIIGYLYDDEDDDDDENYQELAGTNEAAGAGNSGMIVSPFDDVIGGEAALLASLETETGLAFTAENVDKVLDEVRPYLISDGGNVSVERVDESSKIVYLKLEGACGSCPSSTVTMQMGIERVLKEKFPELTQVLQVEDDAASKPTELTRQAVEDEINRLKPAILAMGGVVELLAVDAELGVAKLKYRGASKVQKGLELSLLDVPFLNRVEFVMDG